MEEGKNGKEDDKGCVDKTKTTQVKRQSVNIQNQEIQSNYYDNGVS